MTLDSSPENKFVNLSQQLPFSAAARMAKKKRANEIQNNMSE
jgi:hypothetical protein